MVRARRRCIDLTCLGCEFAGMWWCTLRAWEVKTSTLGGEPALRCTCALPELATANHAVQSASERAGVMTRRELCHWSNETGRL